MKKLKVILVILLYILIFNLVLTTMIDRWINNLPDIIAFKRIPQSFFWNFKISEKK